MAHPSPQLFRAAHRFGHCFAHKPFQINLAQKIKHRPEIQASEFDCRRSSRRASHSGLKHRAPIAGAEHFHDGRTSAARVFKRVAVRRLLDPILSRRRPKR